MFPFMNSNNNNNNDPRRNLLARMQQFGNFAPNSQPTAPPTQMPQDFNQQPQGPPGMGMPMQPLPQSPTLDSSGTSPFNTMNVAQPQASTFGEQPAAPKSIFAPPQQQNNQRRKVAQRPMSGPQSPIQY